MATGIFLKFTAHHGQVLACFGSRRSLVKRIDATVEVAMAGCQDYSLKLAAQGLQPCDICHSTMVHFFIDTVCAVQESGAAKS